jgi:hypothetical protein
MSDTQLKEGIGVKVLKYFFIGRKQEVTRGRKAL